MPKALETTLAIKHMRRVALAMVRYHRKVENAATPYEKWLALHECAQYLNSASQTMADKAENARKEMVTDQFVGRLM